MFTHLTMGPEVWWVRVASTWVFIIGPVHSLAVAGRLGESVSLPCNYDAEHENYNKFWYKDLNKDVIWKTSPYQREASYDRIYLRDDISKLTVTMTIKDLRMKDAGTYTCEIGIFFRDRGVTYTLAVLPGPTQEQFTSSKDLLERTLENKRKHQTTTQAPEYGDKEVEARPSFSVFNAVQVAQIGILLLFITLGSILCPAG
ncbi:CMRF35-like molecule 1 isoform X1 [Ambystoma mexicanum]|uniref:CMRF35-like molecule 1 isoform X1 n=1 Tax=Ambystoma mexicanum TaxID=8296 RepID=UPI0037E9A1E9